MPKKPIPFHPLLIAAFPVLFLYSHNIGSLALNVLAAPLALSVGAAALLFFLANTFTKDAAKTALILSLFLMLFFSYGHAYQAIGAAGISVKTGPALFALWSSVFAFGAYRIAKAQKDLTVPTYLCNSIAAVLVVLSVVNISYHEFNRSGARDAVKADSSGAETGKKRPGPDIYYIVVDAYAGNDVLKEVYGYDNSAFTDYLTKKGFYVAGGAASNYARTGLSLASTLNMDYLDTVMGHLDTDSQDVSLVNRLTENGKVFGILRKRGYTIAALSSGCVESEVRTADIYMKPFWAPDEFMNMVIGTTPLPFILDLFGSGYQYDIHRGRILFEFDRLADSVGLKQPFFFFAHIGLPHPPFAFGPEGEKLRPELIFNNEDGDALIRRGRMTRDRYLRYYTDQLIFTNRKLQVLIDALLSRPGDPPVIILQSDHGPRSMLKWKNPNKTDFRECMSILSAYYLPGAGETALYENISPVNTFRLVFNRYLGSHYPVLEDKSFFSTAEYPYRFIDVSEAAQRKEGGK